MRATKLVMLGAIIGMILMSAVRFYVVVIAGG